MSVPLIVHDQGDSPFDKIRHFRPDGVEYWSARELMPYLGYASWQKMEGVVERARLSCVKQGYDPADHFTGAGKMVDIGSGAARNVDDYQMTRFGCYLAAMNGDVRKPEVALAQGYFAAMTRVAELAGQQAQPPAVEVDHIIATCLSIMATRRAQLAGEARVD